MPAIFGEAEDRVGSDGALDQVDEVAQRVVQARPTRGFSSDLAHRRPPISGNLIDARPHSLASSANYALATAGGVGQPNWRWCQKCEGLFFGGGAGGKCAVGGAHDGSRSGDYTTIHNDPAALGQEQWRYCRKCDGLFFAGGSSNACPGGGGHDGSASGAYKVRMTIG